jgi:CheY-like chemotaxis protein
VQLSIVVIEDNDDAREMLRVALELEGQRVGTAATARDGVAAALRERADAVLVDIGLPDLDGFQVCRQLRDKLGPEPIIVALTGYGQPEDRERSEQAGFDGHVVKPVEPHALLQLLADIVRRRRR